MPRTKAKRKRIVLNEEQRQEVRTLFRSGQLTNTEIGKRYNVAHTTITRICEDTTRDLAQECTAKINSEINILQKTTPQESTIIAQLVDDKIKDEINANKYARYIMSRTMRKLNDADDDELTFNDLNIIQRQTQLFKDTTVGRQPTTAVQINNQATEPEILILPANGREEK